MTPDLFYLRAVWQGIHARCNVKSSHNYKRYGAVGISLHPCWEGKDGQLAFMQWALDNGWKKGLVIDRITDARIYSPETCRVTTQKQNNRNKTNNRLLTYQGETKCVADWADDPRCSCKGRKVFSNRITMGWPIERALQP
jgi:hypothetical protein